MIGAAWAEVRIRSLFSRRNETGRPERPLLSVYRDFGVVPREGREDNFNKPGDDLGAYRVVRRGDLVLNKMKTWQGSLGVSDHDGIVSPAYFVCKPTGSVDGRFIHHLLRSPPLIAQYAARSKGIRPSQWDLPWEEFADIRIRVPAPREQRAIADYLDAETARIDALIAKKRSLIDLLSERERSVLNTMLVDAAEPSRTIRLGQVVDRIIDYRGATPEKATAGIPLLTATNVADGRIDMDASRQFVSEEVYRDWMRRGLPQAGDILLTTEAPLGHVAMIDSVEVALAQRLMLLRVRHDLVESSFLMMFLRSVRGQAELLSRASGSTVMGVRTDRLREVEVQVPPLDEQRAIVRVVTTTSHQAESGRQLLLRQISLLVERRQALITAAVTGQLPIPGLAA